MPSDVLAYRSLSFFYFSYFAFLGVWLPYWTLYLEQQLLFSAVQIGQIMALSTAARIVGPYFWGLLSDSTGERLLCIRFGALCSLISFSFILLHNSFYFVLTVIFIYSFFWNAILSQFEAVTLNFLGINAWRYSRVRLWGSVGFIVFVLILGTVFEIVSLAALPFFMMALLLMILLSSLLVPDEPSPAKSGSLQKASSSFAQFKVLLVQPSVYLMFIVFFLQQFSFAPYYTFFSIYLDDLGYGAAAIAWFWALGVIAEVALFAVMHRLLAAYSLLSLLKVSLLLTSIRWLLTGMIAENVYILFIMQLLHAVSFAALHAIAMEWLRLRFPRSLQGQAQALYSASAYGVGGVLGALISGYVWGFWQEGLFYMAAVTAFIAFLLTLTFKRLS